MGEDDGDDDGEHGIGLDACAAAAGLELPSNFSAEERGEYELEKLADCELQIREGMVFDQLNAVRLAVQHRAAHLDYKTKAVKGAKANAAVKGGDTKGGSACVRAICQIQ